MLVEHLNEYSDRWALYFVSENYGNNPNHHFWKFALIPIDTPGYSKKACKQRGWEFEGWFCSNDNVYDLNQLEELLDEYFEDEDENDVEHVHIAIMMDELDTEVDADSD